MSSKPLNQPLLLKIILSIFCHQRLYKRWSLCWKIFLGHSSCRIQKLLQTSPALQLKNRTRWRLRLFLKHGKPETNQTHLFNFLGCFHVTHPEVFSAKAPPLKRLPSTPKVFLSDPLPTSPFLGGKLTHCISLTVFNFDGW